MKKFTAGYSNTNKNFVIQNLPGQKNDHSIYFQGICIIQNIIQRGSLTIPSKYLQDNLKGLSLKTSTPLIGEHQLIWERIIRGDRKNNYNPAQHFYDVLIPKYLIEYPYLGQLIVPEVPINEITQIETAEFVQQQVDFYLPLAFLVVEIDGTQHDAVVDQKRDLHLAKFGIKTIRISTLEVDSESPGFINKINKIKERVIQISKLQIEKKAQGFDLFSFEDYARAFRVPVDSEDPSLIAASVIRFQILVLELIKRGQLNFSDSWEFTILSDEKPPFWEIATNDLFIWFKNIFNLQRITFRRPECRFNVVKTHEDLNSNDGKVKIDFSLRKRYTDEFQNNSDIIYVRSDYFDHYRYYKNTNSITPDYVDLERIDYFQMATTTPYSYKIKIGDEWSPEQSLSFFLENIFGYSIFFSGQLPIIINALSRNDTIGLLPTGGGKSVCYQLAALLQPALSFVVSPIKSLMYDQKQDLDAIFISRVAHITGDDDGEEKDRIMRQFVGGRLLFILISPERFQIKGFRDHLLAAGQSHSIAFAVIDEVHCLSEWGHDFRTSYLNLSKTISKHCKGFTFLGLTATASIHVLKDIQLEFGIKQENVKTLTDYTRRELDFTVIADKNNKEKEIKNILRILDSEMNIFTPNNENSKCGIIFTPTVNGTKGCYNLSTTLEKEFRTPVKYYSGQVPSINQDPIMNSKSFEEYKQHVQREFKKNEFTLLVATKAFGMGVNKHNIHYTIHFGIPGSMESLYQEAGRAGRDKQKFLTQSARCFVLFTRTSNDEALRKIWSRETTFSHLIEILPTVDGDINTNLFLFKNGLEVIKDEFELIRLILLRYGKPSSKAVRIISKDVSSNKGKTEKAIYRLAQLGVINDWMIVNFFTGEFDVEFNKYDENTVQEELAKTINKYDKEFSFDALRTNELYGKYQAIWAKDESPIDKCIVILLQWAYDHFAYNRRQSLKNIYENCQDCATGIIDKGEFKQRLEDYFRFSEVSYLLQHIAENPQDLPKWFAVFYSVDRLGTAGNIINWEQRQSLLANLSRFLESYEYNVGLDFVSGVLRLLLNDFGNLDGKERLDSAFKRIMAFNDGDRDMIIDKLLGVGSGMDGKNKEHLAIFLLGYHPNNLPMLTRVQVALSDEYSTEKMLKIFFNRLEIINTQIHDGLKQIR